MSSQATSVNVILLYSTVFYLLADRKLSGGMCC